MILTKTRQSQSGWSIVCLDYSLNSIFDALQEQSPLSPLSCYLVPPHHPLRLHLILQPRLPLLKFTAFTYGLLDLLELAKTDGLPNLL